MIKIYGIRNCDTCRKALKWLEAEGIEHKFHDFRRDGLDAAALDGWVRKVGWQKLLNRRGTTWRNLSEPEKDHLDGTKAEALMIANPTLIKRPVFDCIGEIVVGFGTSDQHTLKALRL